MYLGLLMGLLVVASALLADLIRKVLGARKGDALNNAVATILGTFGAIFLAAGIVPSAGGSAGPPSEGHYVIVVRGAFLLDYGLKLILIAFGLQLPKVAMSLKYEFRQKRDVQRPDYGRTVMHLRDRESDNIKKVRGKFAKEFALAEETLDLAARIFSNRDVTPPGGDVLVGRIALGLIIKIINVFWEVISATEKALPSSSQVREMAEALISLAYILKEDSPVRAQLYVDRVTIQNAKDISRILNEPELRGDITPDLKKAVDEKVDELTRRRGNAEVDKMWKWQSWGGDFTIETMARKAGVPPALYVLLYATESRAPHALDIAHHVRVNPDGSLGATLPGLAERHLMPSTSLVIVTLDMGTQVFGISGYETGISALNKRVEEVSGIK